MASVSSKGSAEEFYKNLSGIKNRSVAAIGVALGRMIKDPSQIELYPYIPVETPSSKDFDPRGIVYTEIAVASKAEADGIFHQMFINKGGGGGGGSNVIPWVKYIVAEPAAYLEDGVLHYVMAWDDVERFTKKWNDGKDDRHLAIYKDIGITAEAVDSVAYVWRSGGWQPL